METFNVFIDEIRSKIAEKDFENYNVVVNKSNGYSHDFLAIEKFDKSKHFYTKKCPFTGKIFSYVPTHLTTKPIDSFVLGSSQVSFS